MALRGSSLAAMTSGQSRATSRSTIGRPRFRISARNSSGVGAARSGIAERASVRDELISVTFVAARIDAFCAKGLDVRGKPLLELLIVSRTFRAPGHLGQGKEPREGHKLEIALG